jgi:hypothetical protein
MIDIKFEINGKRVDPSRIGDALEKAVLGKVSDHILKVLSSVRCPEHGTSPKVTVKGRSLDNLSFEMAGCCQALIDAATAKLK